MRLANPRLYRGISGYYGWQKFLTFVVETAFPIALLDSPFDKSKIRNRLVGCQSRTLRCTRRFSRANPKIDTRTVVHFLRVITAGNARGGSELLSKDILLSKSLTGELLRE